MKHLWRIMFKICVDVLWKLWYNYLSRKPCSSRIRYLFKTERESWFSRFFFVVDIGTCLCYNLSIGTKYLLSILFKELHIEPLFCEVFFFVVKKISAVAETFVMFWFSNVALSIFSGRSAVSTHFQMFLKFFRSYFWLMMLFWLDFYLHNFFHLYLNIITYFYPTSKLLVVN